MRLKLFLISWQFFIASVATAQFVHFPAEGTIEFEKRVNMYALIKRTISKDNESYMTQAFEQYKRNQPQFKTLKSTLVFSQNRTLFTPLPETSAGGSFFANSGMAQQNNTIYTDFGSNTGISQRKVYEQTYLVKDSIRHINWKITSETREIAGYSCRRANALILDSIYVVAFYTDKIPVSGGPESFTGLPGMILGVALPHENVTWFASSVTVKSNLSASVKPPVKGKVMNNAVFKETLLSALKDWGDYAKEALKAFFL